MKHRNPAWPRIVLSSGEGPDRATLDWTQGTALGESTSYQLPEGWESAECSCLDRSLAELEELLNPVDADTTDH